MSCWSWRQQQWRTEQKYGNRISCYGYKYIEVDSELDSSTQWIVLFLLIVLQRFVASRASLSNPRINKPHFLRKSSDISCPDKSHGGLHAMIPRFSISSSGNPSKRPQMVSDNNSSFRMCQVIAGHCHANNDVGSYQSSSRAEWFYSRNWIEGRWD